MVRFFNGRQEDDLVGHLAIFDHPVRAFQEAILIGAGIGGQRVDQADVRTFRCFNRTDTTKWIGCTSRTSKPARSRVRPPGPSADTRRLWVISDSGLFWSMNWESWLEPKNSFTAAATGLALIRSCGIRPSLSAMDKRSLTARSTRTRPIRNWFSAISPTQRTRRLPR